MSLVIDSDLRATLGPVRDQGRRATCLAFAASAVHGHLHRYNGQFCVEWLFYHAVTRAGDDPADGSTIEDTQAVLSELGQPDEAFWPYKAAQPDSAAWQPPSDTTVLFRCGSNYCDGTAGAIRQTLKDRQPVVLGLLVTDAFHGPWRIVNDEAVLEDDGLPGERRFGHAVVAVGHGTLDGAPHLLIRNSWGQCWGRNGHAWMAEEDVGRRFIGAFTVREGVKNGLQSEATGPHDRTRLA